MALALWLFSVCSLPALAAHPRGEAASTLAFVFDVTGSMYDDLLQVTEGAAKILESALGRASTPISNFALVPFHDPEIGPVTVTSDSKRFQRELRDLYVQGGGDCPEMSMGAIKQALEVSQPRSFIYVFTDARAKDYQLTKDVLQLVQLKQSQVVFVLTGDCGDRGHPGYRAFEEVASMSSGQIFHLDKQQVNEVLKWVERTIQVSKVHLLSTDHKEREEHLWLVPFDPNLKEVTISLSGPMPTIEILDPLGRFMWRGLGLNELLNIPNSARVVNVKNPRPGMWTIKLRSTGRHSARITGVSSIDFRAGFSTKPTSDFQKTSKRPIQGIPTHVLLNCSGLHPPGQLDQLELLSTSGETLMNLPIRPNSSQNTNTIWKVPEFMPPNENFFLKVTGYNREGYRFQRLSSVSYTNLVPGPPVVSMPRQTHCYYMQPASIRCSVKSLIPFTLRIIRNGTRIDSDRLFLGSVNTTWEISSVSGADEGFYDCVAISNSGTGIARTFLVVTEPPPIVETPQNVTAFPGDQVVLTCKVLGSIRYNITWMRDGTELQDDNEYITPLRNSSLAFWNVQSENAGRYECVAVNMQGSSQASVWLFIPDSPHVTVIPSSRTFLRAMEVQIHCTVTGYPDPEVVWIHKDSLVTNNDRFVINEFGTLIIKDAVPKDAGSYTCLASNSVGTDKGEAKLKYLEIPTITVPNSVILAVVTGVALLECWTAGVPQPEVKWYKGDLELALVPFTEIDPVHGTLWIRKVQQVDAGEYTCVASNEAGRSSATIMLDVGSAPLFLEMPSDMSVTIGKNVTLPCSAVGEPVPQVTWRRLDGQPIFSKTDSMSFVSQLETGSLFIEGVWLDDEGMYVCEAQNLFGVIRSEVALTISGLVAPEVVESAPVINVLEGRSLTLPCVVLAGNPFPEHYWLKDNQLLSLDSRLSIRSDGSFFIERTEQGDAGKYICTIRNVVGSVNKTITVYVHVLPSIKHGQTVYITDEGVAVTLLCESSGTPKPTVVWSKGKELISRHEPQYSIDASGKLLIPYPSAEDSGIYICTATNVAGVSSREMQLFVHTKPQIDGVNPDNLDKPIKITATAGTEVTLPCEVQGSPPPIIRWKKDSRLVPLVSARYTVLPLGSLMILDSRASDSGLYKCSAINRAGNASLTLQLIVQVPPKIHLSHHLLKVIVGQSIDLPCLAHGDPTPKIRWYKDDEALLQGATDSLDGPDGSINIADVELSDAGIYRCEATNNAGHDMTQMTLEVLEPPFFAEDIALINAEQERLARDKVILPCPVNGTPPPVIRWLKNGLDLLAHEPGISVLEDGSLLIDSASPYDSGDYLCVAMNEAGSSKRKYRLNVQAPPEIRGNDQVQNITVSVNQPLMLECDASGSPTPTLSWYKNEQQVTETSRVRLLNGGQVLRLSKSRKGDSGVYSCNAVNVAGTAKKYFNLLVQVPPSIYGSGVTQEVAILVNSKLELTCRANGVPFPHIAWNKDGEALSPGVQYVEFTEEGQTLHIQTSHLIDQGLYQCVAFNPAGQKSKHFKVNVYVPPTIQGVNDTKEVIAQLKSHVSLQCDAHGIPAPGITWLKDGRPIVSSSKMTYVERGQFLLINEVQASDQGWYTCRARNIAGSMEKSYRMQVYVPPRIEGRLHHPLKTKAIVGHSLTLTCSSSGYPPPVLSWLKDGVSLTDSDRIQLMGEGKTLKIENVRESDAGTYTCMATSAAGEEHLQYTVDILVPPQLLIEESSHVTVTIDNPLELACKVTGNPPPKITWLRNNIMLTELDGAQVSAHGSKLFIPRLKSVDVGRYVCVARNEAGERRREFNVTIHVPPVVTIVGVENLVIVVGKSAILECTATGIPTPSISWLKNSQLLTETSGRLKIEKVTQQDEGIYSCIATNGAGESQQDTRVTVYEPPVINKSVDTNKTVTMNLPASFECLASGTPPPVLTWFKGQKLITDLAGSSVLENGRTLRIQNAQVSDGGQYRCVATNVAGSTELQYSLKVYVPPVISTALHLVTVLINQPIELQCEATGDPPPKITWLKDNTPISMMTEGLKFLLEGQILSLASAHFSDSGVYSCVAVNAAGEDQKQIHLQVYLPPSILGEEQNVSVTLNDYISLDCQSQAFPPPTLRWTKDGQPLPMRADHRLSENASLFEIKSAQIQDAGRYTCEASNNAGKTEKNYNLHVWVPPTFYGLKEQISVTVTEGNTLSLFCDCIGIPYPTLEWQKNGKPLSTVKDDRITVSSGSQMLQIARTRISDAANYTCIGTNLAGTNKQDYSVEIYVMPSIKNGGRQPTEISIARGAEITLECEADGVPWPTLTWVKDGRPVVSRRGIQVENEGRSLKIQRAQEDNTGRYTCLAINVAGQSDRKFDLSVHVPPAIIGEIGAPENISTLLSNSISLICEATGVPPPVFTWFRNGSPIVSSTRMQILSGGRTLKLTRVLMGDAGHYSCVASNSVGEAAKDFHVDVLSPPSILNENQVEKLEVKQKQDINMTCLTTGNPKPQVTWLRDGQELNDSTDYRVSSDGSVLEIFKATLSHTGQYTCVASNSVGDKSINYHLSVLVTPRIPNLGEDGTPEDVIVIVNNPTSLACEAEAYPSPTITWLKDGIPFKASRNIHLLPGGRGLQILNVQEENAGRYSCVVTNIAGEAVKDYELKVFIPPVIAKDDQTAGGFRVTQVKTKVNTTLTLVCESWATPVPALRWYKDGQLLTGTEHLQILDKGRILQIRYTRVSDTGRYTCVATNIAGEDEKDFHVNIQVPPIFQKLYGVNAAWEVINRVDEAEEIVEHREVIVNNPVSLYCETNAIPPPILSWYKDGEALSATDDVLILPGSHILQIPRVRADDAGRYTCRAVNEVGEDQLHYELVILIPPVIHSEGGEFGEELVSVVNKTVKLHCEAAGKPPPSIFWFRDSLPIATDSRHQLLDNGSILQIHAVQASDAAGYICLAENSAGSTKKLFSLRVQVPPMLLGPSPENVSVVMNNPIWLTCEYRALPSADIEWYKNGQLLQSRTDMLILPGGHILHIPRAKTEHNGNYVCVATNAAGRDMKDIHLHVYLPPSIKYHGDSYSEAITIRAGETATLRCESEAVPVPTVMWYKNDHHLALVNGTHILSDGQILQIQDAQVTDSGHYMCNVANLAGQMKRTFRLNVHSPPTFEEPLEEVINQTAGKAFGLSCQPLGVPPPTITWLKNGEPLDSGNSQDWHILSSGSRLQTIQLQIFHSGNYSCLARNSEGEVRKHFSLFIQVPPSILGSTVPTEYDAIENEDVKLECVTTGEPKPILKWFKEGQPLETLTKAHFNLTSDGSSLDIKGVLVSDTGKYTCVAWNPSGEETKMYILNVLIPPNISGVSSHPEIITVVPNAAVTLECRAAGTPPPQLTWLKDGLPLPISSHVRLLLAGQILRIAHVQISDAGTYTCVAVSQAGMTQRHYQLQVQVPPRFENSGDSEETMVIRGASVSFTCDTGGIPPPVFSWLKDGELLVLNDLSLKSHEMKLHLPSVDRSDSGWYSCIAVNDAGKATRHFNLVVMEPPQISDSEMPQEVSVVLSSLLELVCTAIGVPAPEISWMKDGVPLDGTGSVLNDGKVLRIERVQVEDAGLYTCLAANLAGEDQLQYLVRINVPPNIIGSSDAQMVTLLAEEQLTLECKSEADPPPVVQWFKDDVLLQANAHIQNVPDRRYLLIDNVGPSDAGMYSCLLSNIAGQMTHSFNVIIHVTPTIKANSPSLSVIINQVAFLECEAEGIPKPTVTWRKDGNLLPTGSPRFDFLSEGSLQIHSVQISDAGHYLCTASNAVGTDHHRIELQVLDAPIISPAPTNITALANVQAELSCEVSGTPKPEVIWKKNGKPLNFKLQQNMYRLLPSGSLVIISATTQDTALYECVVSNEAGDSHRLIQFTVHVPPSIADDSPNVTITKMSSVVLTCHATGIPEPAVSWMKDGAQMGNRGPGYKILPTGSLEVTTATLSHAGSYMCTARNVVGTAHRHVTLIVQEPPVIKPLPSTVETVVNRGIILPCESTGTPRPSITWQKEGATITNTGYLLLANGALEITRATEEYSGNYMCIAQNPAGTALGKTKLVVQVPPIIKAHSREYKATIDHPATLPCEAEGHPKPEVTWVKDGRTIANQMRLQTFANGSLQILPIQLADAGWYTCVARNKAGVVSLDTILVVQVPPSIVIGQLELSVLEDSQALVPCVAQGSPAPVVYWEKDGVAVPDVSGKFTALQSGELIVENTTPEDAGVYTCTAVSAAGKASHDIRLFVSVQPAFTELPADVSLHKGERLLLTCAAKGLPIPLISWNFNNKPITAKDSGKEGRSELIIEKVSKEHSGTYVCTAESDVGMIKAVGFVYVKEAPVLHGEVTAYQTEPLGGNVVLNCDAHGDPAPSINWNKNGRPLTVSNRIRQMNNGSLAIYGTVNEDAGDYKCVAENEAGVVERKVTLMLQSAPVFTVEPLDTVVSVGDRVLLYCQAAGEPSPTVEWTKNGHPIRENGRLVVLQNSTLQILSAVKEDTGEYECVARNLMGSSFVGITVTVQVHGGFSEWLNWGPCSVTCGQGIKERIRLCNNPLPANGGRSCHGWDVESRQCNAKPCPVHGQWSLWGAWEGCSQSCGQGNQTRRRSCSDPPTQHGGRPCEGKATEVKKCIFVPCPVDGQWTAWNSWSRCSASCGGGVHQRTRSCFDPPPQYGGNLCEGSDVDVVLCNNEPCPVNGNWGSWSSWNPCSQTCGGGQSKRYRSCGNPAPANGGNICSGVNVQMQRCGIDLCPVNGGWSPWQPWSECSASCGGGTQLRKRQCNSPPPNGNGRGCPGESFQTASCSYHPCPGVPGRARGSLIGIINDKEFGIAFLDANITANAAAGTTTLQANIQNIPSTIGPLVRVLASVFTPIYWSVAFPAPGTANGFTLTKGVFRQESQMEFATGEILRMTHVARGVDTDGVLLFDVVINGYIPRNIESADIAVKDFSEKYVQTGPGQLYVSSTQTFLNNGSPVSFHCNHTIEYESGMGNQPSPFQILKAEYISVFYNVKMEELNFRITVSFQKGSTEGQCPRGYILDSSSYCTDIDECQLGIHMCHFGQNCQNEAGSYRCLVRCGIGFKQSAEGAQCEDINECEESANPPCQQRCLNAVGTYRCGCDPGYQRRGQHCVDINECNMNVCRPDQECQNTEGGYQCTESCPHGTTRLPSGTCGDVDECKTGDHLCRYNQKCENTAGGYHCSCPHGYRSQGVGRPCLDVDECQQIPKPCVYQCRNLVGSYKCLCPPGKQLQGDAKSCAGLEKPKLSNSTITSFRPQLVSISQYSHSQQTSQNQINPFYTWLGWKMNREHETQDNRKSCPTGYRKRNGVCTDINECQTWHFCQHDCKNTQGSYRCICPSGYRLLPNGRSCQDIDECQEQNIKCGLNQMCFNMRGSHQCIDTPCPASYRRGPSPGTCYRRCILHCSAGPLAFQYKLLTLPRGIPAKHDVIRLSAFSERGVLQSRTNFTAIEQDVASPFAIRTDQGRGIVHTLHPLMESRVYRLKVHATTFSEQGPLKYHSVFVIVIAVSPYPY
ncbi:hemicentin-1-like isoform X1 [Chiloscyllium punctatum]|uniref:hemicentin-1-like isoform X1 n=1 Tax=Chiloscyllium punctatum TaxID=137246 RepID=UPI003B637DBD